MSRNELKLNIYGFYCHLLIDCEQVQLLLQKDFSYFVVESFPREKNSFVIEANVVDDYVLPEGMLASSQTKNSITFRQASITYNDYYGKALTKLEKNRLTVQSLDKKFLHEILYLMILSYSQKNMDLRGFHKIHACAFRLDNTDMVVMMPSKGGKSTILMDMLMDPEVQILSDDSPVVSRNGHIQPFPLRLGAEVSNDLIKRFPYLHPKDLYSFERLYYSPKYLVDIQKIKNKVASSKAQRQILLTGVRSTNSHACCLPIGRLKMFHHLLRHMIVGMGLPMIIEHFLRSGFKDHLLNVYILFSRFYSALVLISRSECYEVHLCRDKMKNRQVLVDLASER